MNSQNSANGEVPPPLVLSGNGYETSPTSQGQMYSPARYEEGMSPRPISPLHTRRMDTTPHFVPGDHGGLKFRIMAAEGLVHPRVLHSVKEPVVRVHIGNLSHSTITGKPVVGKKGTFEFNMAMELPYRGHTRIRFLVYDVYKKNNEEVGFHDMNLTTMMFDENIVQSGFINLMGRKGLSGKLYVTVEPVRDQIMEPHYGQIVQGEIVPLPEGPMGYVSPTSAANRSPSNMNPMATERRGSSFSDASSVLEEMAESGRMGATNEVRVMVADGFVEKRLLKEANADDYFIKATFGKKTLRSQTTVRGGQTPSFHEEFRWPFDGHRSVAFAVYINRKMKSDMKVGTGSCLLNPAFGASGIYHPQRVELRNKQNEVVGYLNVKMQADCVAPAPHHAEVIELNQQISQEDREDLESELSSISADDVKQALQVAEASPAVRGLPANVLRLTLIRGEDLRYPYKLKENQKPKLLNPYVYARLGEEELRCHTVYRGGHIAPVFTDTMYFPYTGERFVRIECRNDKPYSKDKRIGYTMIDLDNHARLGAQALTMPLLTRDPTQSKHAKPIIAIPAGRIVAVLEFCNEMGEEFRVPRVLRTLPHQALVVGGNEGPRPVMMSNDEEMERMRRLEELRLAEEARALEENRRQEELMRLARERQEAERLERERLDGDRLERERLDRLEAERLEAERLEALRREEESRQIMQKMSSDSLKAVEAAVAVEVLQENTSSSSTLVLEESPLMTETVMASKPAAPVKQIIVAEERKSDFVYPEDVLRQSELRATREGYRYVCGPPHSIRLRLIRATGLRTKKDKDMSDCDPYVEAYIGHTQRECDPCNNTVNPIFHQTMIWEFNHKHPEIDLKVKDKKGMKDSTLCEGVLNLAPYIERGCNREYECVVPMTSKKGGKSELFVSVEASMSDYDKHQKVVESSKVSKSREVSDKENMKNKETYIMHANSMSSISSDHIGLERAEAIKTIRVLVVAAEGIAPCEKADDARGMYAYGKLGSDSRRSTSVRHMPNAVLGVTFQWPYKQQRCVKMQLFDDLDNHNDPKLGEAMINLGPAVLEPNRPMPMQFKLYEDADKKDQKARGILKVVVEALTTEWDRREVIEAEGLVGNLTAPEARGLDRSSSGSSDHIETGTAMVCQSIKMRVISAEGIPACERPDKARGVYPYCKLHKSLRGRSVVHDLNPRFTSVFVFPYKQQREMMVSLYDDFDNKNDPCLGEALVELSPVIKNLGMPHRMTIELYEDKDKKVERRGRMLVEFEASRNAVSGAQVLEEGGAAAASTAVVGGARSISSVSSDHIQTDQSKAIQSVQIRMLHAQALPDCKYPDKNRGVYGYCKLGHAKVQSTPVPHTRVPCFTSTLCYQYKDQRTALIKMYDNLDDKNDQDLGQGYINLAAAIDQPGRPIEQVVRLYEDADKKTDKRGFLLVAVTALRVPFDGREKIEGSALPPRELSPEQMMAAPMVSAASPMSASSRGVSPMAVAPIEEVLSQSPCKGLRLIVLNASNLKNPHKVSAVDTIDPYLEVTLGSTVKTSEHVKDAGLNPVFNQQFCLPYTGTRRMQIVLKDNAHMSSDPLIGQTVLDLGDYVNKGEQLHPVALPLLTKKQQPGGVLNCMLQVLHSQEKLNVGPYSGAGMVSAGGPVSPVSASRGIETSNIASPCRGVRLAILTGHDLKNPHKVSAVDTIDPYATVTMGSQVQSSEAVKDGGLNPKIMSEMCFPYTGSQVMKIELFDKAHMSSDPLIGVGELRLSEYVNRGEMAHEVRVPLLTKKKAAGGYLLCKLQILHSEESKRMRPYSDTTSRAVVEGSALPMSPVASTEVGMMVEQALCRGIKVAVLRATDLKKPKKMMTGKMDPRVVCCFGKEKLQGSVMEDRGTNTEFKDGFRFPYRQHGDIIEMAVMSGDNLVGKHEVSLYKLVQNSRLGELENGNIVTEKGKNGGLITFRVEIDANPVAKAELYTFIR